MKARSGCLNHLTKTSCCKKEREKKTHHDIGWLFKSTIDWENMLVMRKPLFLDTIFFHVTNIVELSLFRCNTQKKPQQTNSIRFFFLFFFKPLQATNQKCSKRAKKEKKKPEINKITKSAAKWNCWKKLRSEQKPQKYKIQITQQKNKQQH